MGCCESTHAVATANTITKKQSEVGFADNVEEVPENVSNDQENGNMLVVEQEEEKKEEAFKNGEMNLVENKTNLEDVSVNEALNEGGDNEKEDKRPVQETTTETQCETLVVAPIENEDPVKENEDGIAIVQPTEPEETGKDNENTAAVLSPEPGETILESLKEDAAVVPSPEEAKIEKDGKNVVEETAKEMETDVSASEPEEATEEKEPEDTRKEKEDEDLDLAMVPSPQPEETVEEKEEENAAIVSSPELEEKKNEEATVVLEPETTINENEREPEGLEIVESTNEQENTPATNQESAVNSTAEVTKTD